MNVGPPMDSALRTQFIPWRPYDMHMVATYLHVG